jgi:DNA-binding XRE family transcriptional regulator
MNVLAPQRMLGHTRRRREVRDVPEASFDRDDLAKIIGVRKQRLDRLERESIQARSAWRATRAALRDAKQCWRTALQEAQDFWQQARTEFLTMTTTSGQFRKAKAHYERMKSLAAQRHLECREAVLSCKEKRTQFFEARRRVLEAKRQQEKLVMMRNEIRMSQVREEW